MEKVTVEQNGERFVLEVEEGTTDEEILQFLQAQQAPAAAPSATGGSMVVETPAGLDRSGPPPMSTGQQVAAGTAAVLGTSALGYGASKAAPYVADAARAIAPAAKSLPGNIIKQYAARPLTGLAADVVAMGAGYPPPTATTEFAKSMGRGGTAAARQFVSTGPVAPPTAAQIAGNPALKEMAARSAAPQPGMLQRGMDYAAKMREIAANKVMSNAGLIKQAGVGAAAALTPGNVGQQYNFPTKGPYAGQEINPMTGRPWTPEELAQYR
jgi:hypothetical protein